jgi:hypothetical protein
MVRTTKASTFTTPMLLEEEKRTINRNSFTFMHQIGSGGFGSVWKVKDKHFRTILAMK